MGDMTYDYFLASRWRNQDAVLELLQKLRAKGKSVYCFLEKARSLNDPTKDPEEEMQAFEAIVDWRADEAVKRIFQEDMDGLKQSASLILLLPAGKSAHVEAGAAYGMGKRCILVGQQKETESLYFIFDEWYNSIDDFIQTL